MELDYGAAHMGAPIYFNYQPATVIAMTAVGVRIRGLRKKRKLNQTQLGEAVGVHQSVISDIENGAGFGADVLIGLADALQTTPHFIMNDGPDEVAREASLLGMYRACAPSDRGLLVETAKAFAARASSVSNIPAATPASDEAIYNRAIEQSRAKKKPPSRKGKRE